MVQNVMGRLSLLLSSFVYRCICVSLFHCIVGSCFGCQRKVWTTKFRMRFEVFAMHLPCVLSSGLSFPQNVIQHHLDMCICIYVYVSVVSIFICALFVIYLKFMSRYLSIINVMWGTAKKTFTLLHNAQWNVQDMFATPLAPSTTSYLSLSLLLLLLLCGLTAMACDS